MAESEGGYWQQVEEIFHQALEIAAVNRAAFVCDRCGGDTALEREVQEILRGYEAAQNWPVESGVAGNQRLGPYELIREIGAGGMGVVYLVRRQEDFDRPVAIKLISVGFLAGTLLAERFRQERQILAGLDHPHIARLLDGGLTPSGQPFLVMEYVAGVRLDQYCEARSLPVEERLTVFQKICSAVHFAHQHLVIHRDLKPANILVTEEGEPKLLDFGIAKVVEQQDYDGGETHATTTAFLLTPQYASPEQLRGERCTAASDIYSLGVILYELLTGRHPYRAASSSLADVIGAIATQDVRRPSAIAPEDRRQPLRGDLDGIVLRALAIRPADRYASAQQFSEDIQRHLEGLPVRAVEGTRLYLARKFILRHRVGVAAAALVLVSLVTGLVTTLWQAHVAKRERALAEQRFSDARQLAKYQLFSLYDAIQSLPGSLPVRADLASESLNYLDRLEATKGKDRALNLELAEGYLRLGGILEAPLGGGDSLGNTRQALETDRKAIALLEALNAENPRDVQVQKDLARAGFLIGSALNFAGKSAEAVARLNESSQILDRLAAANPRDVQIQADAGTTYVALMDVLGSPGGGLTNQSSKDRVLGAAGHAFAHFTAALAISPGNSSALLGTARAENLAGTLQIATDPRAGIVTIQTGLDALHKLSPALQNLQATRIDEARMETMLAFAEEQIGKHAQALATLEHPLQFYERIAAVDPRNATNTRRRMNVYRTLGMIHLDMKNEREALKDYRIFIDLANKLIAVDPSKTSNFVLRGEAQGRAAKILASEGRMPEARQYAKASIDSLERIAERPDAAQQNLCEAAIVLMNSPVKTLRDYPRALKYAERADELANGKSPEALAYLAQAYANNGAGGRALETVNRALALVPPPPPGQKPSDVRQTLENELRGINLLIKTGRLPDDFNQ